MSVPTEAYQSLLDEYKKYSNEYTRKGPYRSKEDCDGWKYPNTPYDDLYREKIKDIWDSWDTIEEKKKRKKPTMPVQPAVAQFYTLKKGAVMVLEYEDGTVSTVITENQNTYLEGRYLEWQQPTVWCFFYSQYTPPCRYIINPNDIIS